MTQQPSRISIIAVLGEDTRAIGIDGDLIWTRLRADKIRFRKLTYGHPVIMGRKTWDSLPDMYRPLPGRTNIIISRDASLVIPGAIVVRSLDDAIAAARKSLGSDEIFIIGGGIVYAKALPYVDRLYLTLVQSDAAGDVFFPEYEVDFPEEIERIRDSEHDPTLTFLTLER
nr:Dihydrofolate reductase [uncultured bacterium]